MTKWGNVQPSLDNSEHIGPDTTGDNIHAKKVALFTFNATSNEWERFGNITSTEEAIYKKLIDDTTTTSVTYVGEAALGTATSAASWRIKKIDESGSPTSITWSGTSFTAIWNNRATTVSYS